MRCLCMSEGADKTGIDRYSGMMMSWGKLNKHRENPATVSHHPPCLK
jgi:hypothetical protein